MSSNGNFVKHLDNGWQVVCDRRPRPYEGEMTSFVIHIFDGIGDPRHTLGARVKTNKDGSIDEAALQSLRRLIDKHTARVLKELGYGAP